MTSLQNNLLALNANRQLKINISKTTKTAEKLSSGYRINRAADDAAGLAISEKMRRRIRGLHQTVENIQEGVGYVQTADGALNEVHDMLQRINELAVKSANGTGSIEDREYIDQEAQALKSELDRIFKTTSFNERLIWEPSDKVLIGTEPKQALEFTQNTKTNDITNANCGVLACNGYTINADKDGVTIVWIGYDGNNYKTENIDWDTLKAQNYRFEMSDYFGTKNPGNLLYDNNGNPVFTCPISFSPQESATIDDIITCINGQVMSGYASVSMSGDFEDISGNTISKDKVRIEFEDLYYPAAYASNHNVGNDTKGNGHNFDDADDKFLEPVDASGALVQGPNGGSNLTSIPENGTSDVNIAKNSHETWSFSYYMDGIGNVTATSSSVTYYAPSDTADDDENFWWHWAYYDQGGNRVYYKATSNIPSNEQGNGTLGSVMATLTGNKGETTPGLLSKANGGDCDNGGYIRLRFDLTSENEFTYGNGSSSKNVGSFTLNFRVDPTDTEQDVLDRINHTLNSSTILDLYSAGSNQDYSHIYSAIAKRHSIDSPIYGGICNIRIQAGTEAGQYIDIKYESLGLTSLGLQDTNMKTVEDSYQAIRDVKKAMQTVSAQRAVFGAYQNRLDHAANINQNVEENTQAAESLIRDTDMSEMLVAYSNYNILLQAETSMLAQANQQPSFVLRLLQ